MEYLHFNNFNVYDMKLYELKKEVDKCEKERIEETETMIINYENINVTVSSQSGFHVGPDSGRRD